MQSFIRLRTFRIVQSGSSGSSRLASSLPLFVMTTITPSDAGFNPLTIVFRQKDLSRFIRLVFEHLLEGLANEILVAF